MKTKDIVSRKIFITSIVLAIVAIGVGAVAAYLKEYIIAGAMLFVLVLQVHNMILYKKKNGH